MNCSLFDFEPRTEIGKLPPITNTGRFNFGFLLNGNAVRVTNSQLMRAETRQDFFLLSFSKTIDGRLYSEESKRLEFILPKNDLEVGVNYDLSNSNIHKVIYTEFENYTIKCKYESKDIIKGNLILSNIDRKNYIISGTFEFEALNANCESIIVTNGRFDMYYFPY
ncbi:hypothetical protein BTO13_02970 [Polaribacter gangjinensis]|uniref:Uncharacterized protein n=2 Tax=Polaribacter gangjinensis TaxID=574710 RepID=A0A2S7WA56_9FLAO|nr:hypothetical protein BTO13_02970 [Polaribacter gangjinensis]